MLPGPLRGERPGPAQPVQERRGAHQQAHVRTDPPVQLADRGEQVAGPQPRRRGGPRRERRRRGRTGCPHSWLDQPQHLLLVPAEPGGRHGQPGPVGQPDDDVEVAGQPLQLGVHHPDQRRRPGHLGPGDPFERVAVGQRVRDGGDALGPLGQQHPVGGGHALEPLLDAAVLVEHPHVQVRDVLAGRLDQVLDRLDHARAHRAVRDGEQAGTRDVAAAARRGYGLDGVRTGRRSPGRGGAGRPVGRISGSSRG